MKKSQMCFPLSIVAAIALLATGVLFISHEWGSYNDASKAPTIGCVSGASLVFAIASLIRAKIEKNNPSTFRTTGILISLICTLGAIAALIFCCTFFLMKIWILFTKNIFNTDLKKQYKKDEP